MPSTIIDSNSASKSVTYRGKFSGDFIVRLGSSDTLEIDFSKVSRSSLNKTPARLTRNGDDVAVTFTDIKSERVLSSITIEGAGAEGGLNRLKAFFPGGQIVLSLDGSVLDDPLFDSASFIGTAASELLTGNDDPDVSDDMSGGAGDDTLVGGAGEDDLTGGSGNDVLTGGADDDTFVFEFVSDFVSGTTAFQKTITDFNAAEDFIDMERLGTALKLKASTTATTANWKKGQIIFQADGADGRILGNLDTDLDAEIVIVLTGVNDFNVNNIGLKA